MSETVLMGIDLGGSGIRVLLLDEDLRQRAVARRPLTVNTVPGTLGTGKDLDLHALWQTLGEAVRTALADAALPADRVTAIAVSAMRYSSVVSDRNGRVLLAANNQDARAAAESFELAADLGDRLLALTGSAVLPVHSSSRLMWLRAHQPDLFNSAAVLYGCGEWLTEKLCGARVMDASQASATGLFGLDNRDWLWEVIDELDLPRKLFPPIADAGTALGRLTPEAALHLGLCAETQVALGGADTQLSLLAMGAVDAGDCAAVAGSTAPVQAVAARPMFDPAGELQGAHHILADRWVIESSAGPTGAALSAIARVLYPTHEQPEASLFAEAAESAPGAMGMLSTLGAGAMNMSAPTVPLGIISLSPMGLENDPAPRRHFARAIAEGVAMGLRANRERLAKSLERTGDRLSDRHLYLGGGLSSSDSFAALLANVIGLPVSVAPAAETAAMGAALCAAVATHRFPDLASAAASRVTRAESETTASAGSRLNRTYAPEQAVSAYYGTLYANWQALQSASASGTSQIAADHLLSEVLREPSIAANTPASVGARPRALVTAALDAASLAGLREVMDVDYANFRETNQLLAGRDLVSALQGKQVFITEVDVLDHSALAKLPELRVVAACRGDAVNVDVEACTLYGIPVLHAPGRNADAVADLTLAFLLNLARKFVRAAHFLSATDVAAGNMGKMGQAFRELEGNELRDKTIGLVGLGSVGRAVAQRLAGFGAHLLACDPDVSAEQAALAGCRLTTLDNLLAQSDFVTLHAAVTPETTGLIGGAELARMKRGSFLINTARAALVDETALLRALQSAQLAGAALDTFATEPPGFDHPLVQHPLVVCTPHIAGNTEEVATHQGRSILSSLRALLNGEPPSKVLNPTVLDAFSWHGPRPAPDPELLRTLDDRPPPAVTDLQRENAAAQSLSAFSSEQQLPEAQVHALRAILSNFCEQMSADSDMRAASAGADVSMQFHIYDIDTRFYLQLADGTVNAAPGTAPGEADVLLEMRAAVLDEIFTGRIDPMESAMQGDIAFMGDATKAITLQHLRPSMERLYTAVRANAGDPGELVCGLNSPAAASSATSEGDDIAKAELVGIMQELYAAQVVTATGGNISVRRPGSDNELWITPSQLFKGDMHPDMMVRINLAGEKLDAQARSPSSEWCMHTRIMEEKPEATAVIHAHAPNATILANAGLPFLPVSSEAAFFGNIPRVPFAMPGTSELADKVGDALRDEWAALMINHGLIVAGRSLRRAADMVEIIERSAEIILGCYAVGKEPPVLPPDAAEHFRKLGDVVA